MASRLFTELRAIENATKIPSIGWEGEISLVRTGNVAADALRAGGAKGSLEQGWHITRSPLVLLEPLDQYLPHLARKAILPNVVDLIPQTSWGASLANMLTAKSWDMIRFAALRQAGACEDCGNREQLECHEMWSYLEGIGVQKLASLRTVCKACHETYHLGLASTRGRYASAFKRLTLINRIAKHEEAEFEDEIFTKFNRRGEIEWILDLSLLSGFRLSLKQKFEEIAPNVIGGDGDLGEVEVSIIGLDIVPQETAGRGLMLA